MIAPLSLPVRRAAALALLGAGLLFVWSLFVSPLLQWESRAASDHARADRLLAAYEQVQRDRPLWEKRLRELESPPYSHVFIEGRDPNLAAARFQARLKTSLEGAGGAIRSIQVLPAQEEGELVRLALRISFSIPQAGFYKWLEAVEHVAPYLFLGNIQVTAAENRLAALRGGQQDHLSVNGVVYSYILPEGP